MRHDMDASSRIKSQSVGCECTVGVDGNGLATAAIRSFCGIIPGPGVLRRSTSPFPTNHRLTFLSYPSLRRGTLSQVQLGAMVR